ncbi:MAG: hypothetical protein RMI79_06265 [Nitrososphaerota archaeon]|nr:hypothetical protein [Nitrososphaerota archaeon]
MGEKITHELHQHLLKVMDKDNVSIRILNEERFSFMLVTEKEVILPLVDPKPKSFRCALKIKSKNFSMKYKEYFLKLYSEGKPLSSQDLPLLCEECSSQKRAN